MTLTEPATDEISEYGFTWGPMTVTRLATIGAHGLERRALGIKTERHKLDIYVSPAGHSVRVFRDGKELT